MFQYEHQRVDSPAAHRPPWQQPLGQVLLVILLKDVLFLKVSEQHHDLIQDTLNVILWHALQALAQLVIHEQANVFRAPLTQVDEGFKAVVQDILESLVIIERRSNDSADRQKKQLTSW